MHNNIEEKLNTMRLEKLKAEELEAENKMVSENIRKDQDVKFDETFGIFFEYIKKCKNMKDNLIELLIHNRTNKGYKNHTSQIMSSYNGVTVNVIPKNIDIIESSIQENHIILGISFEPYDSSESIEAISWFIEDHELCSFIVKNTKPLESDSFYIPEKVYLGFPIKCNQVQVKTVVSSYNYYKYHYIIKINYNKINNEYTFKSINDCILTFNGKKCCCLNIYGRKLDYSIDKNVLLENWATIENDLDNILTSSINENEFLIFEEMNQPKVVFRPFDLDEDYWNKSYCILNDNFITDYPRYIAKQLQQSNNIRELNKKWFEYIC